MTSNKNFQNFKIGHDKEQINEGIDYIFTLKDRNLLDTSDGELDILENQILRETKKNKKFKENNLDLEKKESILSKYDNEKSEGFTLRIRDKIESVEEIQENFEAEENLEELDRIKEKFKQFKQHKTNVKDFFNNFKQSGVQNKEVQLKVEKKFTNDYMTHEEFKSVKPDFKKKKIPPKKGIQSIKTEELEIERLDNKINDIHNKPAPQVYDEYDELNLFLEKQRNLTNKSKKLEPEIVLTQILNSEQEKNKSENLNQSSILENDLKSSSVQDTGSFNNFTEFISETTEFLKKIPSKSEIEENYKLITAPTPFSLKDAKSGTQSVVNIPLPNERLKYGVSSIINPNEKFLNRKRENISGSLFMEDDETKSEMSQSETGIEKIEKVKELEEPLIGKGIATALKVLRSRGVLGKKELWGRFKDKEFTSNEVFLPKKELEKFKNSKIEIEYRDNKGRLLTPKEMFRYQCYIFHGKGPGKKKIEKRLLREQLQEKLNNQDKSESKTFKYLKSFQKKTNSPYLVLQGKNNSLP